jgi:hypothetical protein
MPRRCTECDHAERHGIDKALVSATMWSRRFNTSPASPLSLQSLCPRLRQSRSQRHEGGRDVSYGVLFWH